MAKFVKKPIVVEATQWFKDGDHPKVIRKAKGLTELYVSDSWQATYRKHGYPYGYDDIIETLEGDHKVSPGDWIITGIKGEHYHCKPDIFASTYDPVQT